MDYSRNQRYFKPRPRLKWPLIFLLVGILTSAVGLFLVGLPLAIIAVLWLFVAFGGRPVDADMDAAASSLMGDFRQQAFNKLGVEEEEIALADPIEFWGWDFDARLELVGAVRPGQGQCVAVERGVHRRLLLLGGCGPLLLQDCLVGVRCND